MSVAYRRLGRDGPSPHLRWRELACRDAAKTPYPEEWRSTRARLVGTAFECVRDHWGRPIPILSGYRTPEHNAAVGGAPFSYHPRGLGIDMGRPHGVTLHELWDAALEEAKKPGGVIRGVGKYLWGVHLDCRPTLRLAVWRGKRLQAEVV